MTFVFVFMDQKIRIMTVTKMNFFAWYCNNVFFIWFYVIVKTQSIVKYRLENTINGICNKNKLHISSHDRTLIFKEINKILSQIYGNRKRMISIREIKLDVTSNGKRQKWNFCGLSLALWTVEWKYLYLWRIVGDIFLFLCDLIKD